MSSYSNDKYGLTRRIIFPTVDTMEAAEAHDDILSFPEKTKITAMGLIAQDGDIRVSSDTVLDLIYWPAGGGTTATLLTKAWTTAAVVAATGQTLDFGITATTVAANTCVRPAVGVIGSDGTFHWYLDIEEQFTAV
jgi:hypothetical protein